MKSALKKLMLLTVLSVVCIGTALADAASLECPNLHDFVIENYDPSGNLMPMGNASTARVESSLGGGWVVRMELAQESPWYFWDIVVRDSNIKDGETAWNEALKIRHLSLGLIPPKTKPITVLRKHYFNKDRTGSYFYTCEYPIDSEHALRGDSITATSAIFTDGAEGTSKPNQRDDGEVVFYNFLDIR